MLKQGPLCVLGCYLLLGVLPAFWKLLAALDPFYILAVRLIGVLLVSAVILAVRYGLTGVRAAPGDRRELRRLALAGFVICINWGAYIWAVNSGHILDASLAYYMSPTLAILMGTIGFHERLTRLQWLSVAISFTGLAIAVIRYRQFPWVALIIGGSFAVYGAIKKGVQTDAAASMFFETLPWSPLFLIFLAWMELRGAGAVGALHGGAWLLLPMAGVVTAVPLMLLAHGIKATSMSTFGILTYVNPTMQFLLSVLLYQEEFTATYAILFGFVWTGLALYLLSGFLTRQTHEKERPPCA